MTTYLDRKYVNLVSSSLERFKWKSKNVANCRCPICGDSTTNKTKARGYFFESNNNYFFKCHNCGASHNIYKFLEIISPTLFKEYCLEKFLNKNEKPIEIEIKSIHEYCDIKVNNLYKEIHELNSDHIAVKFLEDRKIPKDKWSRFYYTDHFSKFAKNFNEKYDVVDDMRILIPIYNEHNQMIAVQGRAFGDRKPKYITLKQNNDIKLIYGIHAIDKSKRVFVVEGPIDSMFLPNGIACLGAANFLEIRDRCKNLNLTYILDNEPRNKNIVSIMDELIKNKEKVCIFPENIKEKDINDMVLCGLNICDIIENHTYSDISAKLNFNNWRKC